MSKLDNSFLAYTRVKSDPFVGYWVFIGAELVEGYAVNAGLSKKNAKYAASPVSNTPSLLRSQFTFQFGSPGRGSKE